MFSVFDRDCGVELGALVLAVNWFVLDHLCVRNKRLLILDFFNRLSTQVWCSNARRLDICTVRSAGVRLSLLNEERVILADYDFWVLRFALSVASHWILFLLKLLQDLDARFLDLNGSFLGRCFSLLLVGEDLGGDWWGLNLRLLLGGRFLREKFFPGRIQRHHWRP